MAENLRQSSQNYEVQAAAPHVIIDHMTHDGDRITISVDAYHPDDPMAYAGTRLTRDGHRVPLTVVAPSVGVDEYRRWSRCIEFTDSSYITIDVQRFEVWYHAEGRRELLIPAE